MLSRMNQITRRIESMFSKTTNASLAVAFLFATICCESRAADPETVADGYEERRDAMFRAESGEPLVRKKVLPPMGGNRGNFARHYSWSLIAYAAHCFYLNEDLDNANAALRENAQHYIDNPKDIIDRDSFHWHADIVMRLIDMYGPNGKVHAGRLTAETEAACLKPIWHSAHRQLPILSHAA